MKVRWMEVIWKFYLEIKHIKSEENQVANALNKGMQVIYMETMSTCEIDIKERIKEMT